MSCELGIWDTAGAERFDSLSSFYCRGAQGAACCFDLTQRSSFDEMERRWIRKVTEEAAETCQLVMLGTKADLVAEQPALRAVSNAEIMDLATKHGAEYFETSAKTGQGIDEAFFRLVEGHYEAQARAASDAAETVRLTAAYPRLSGEGCACYG